MATLKLTMEEFSDDPRKAKDVDQQAFAIMSDFLQPSSKTSLSSASESLLALLPDDKPDGPEVGLLCDLCLELAEQIPYSHPSQLKLVWLLRQMAPSPKVLSKLEKNRYHPFGRLGEYFRDNLQYPDPENLPRYVNFHAFVARVEFHVWPMLSGPTWTIWAMRDAFEQDDEYYSSAAVRDTTVLAAAQYVLCKGQDVIQYMVYPGDVSSLNIQHWKPGPKYLGSAHLDLKRWHFWRDGFAAEAAREKASDETKSVAAKAVKMMNALEDTTLGL